MAGPKNASISAGGFRLYEWPNAEDPDEPYRLLSVTSIRKLCGENYKLVAWQINNVINAAMGTTARVRIGPRGGRSKVYVRDGDFPGAFLSRMIEGKGTQASLDSTRKWLRETADAPRDIAAVRGTLVHEAIELGASTDMIDRRYVEVAVGRLSPRDQKKMKAGVTDEDVAFIHGGVAQYWDMRAHVPFVLIAREPQVFNLTAGYGGSADALFWFLPDGAPESDRLALQKAADDKGLTIHDIEKIGGDITLGDWKTSKGVYTDHVIQAHAYLAAEFIGADGVIDERLTPMLKKANEAAIVHIRPTRWSVDFTEFRMDVLRGFLGSVAYARLLAAHEQPFDLFTRRLKGATTVEGIIEEEKEDADDE